VPIRSQMSLTSSDTRSPPRARPAALQSVAAVLSASLLGVGLAYCACTLLIPAAAREGSNAPVVSVDGPLQDVICSSGDSATSPRQARIDE
jgi:hypothetical protein